MNVKQIAVKCGVTFNLPKVTQVIRQTISFRVTMAKSASVPKNYTNYYTRYGHLGSPELSTCVSKTDFVQADNTV